MSTAWYVLQTKPRKEEFVLGQLASRQAEVFFPRLAESLGRLERVAPMFPSYLFVKLDVEQLGKGVRYTPGVKDFLRCDGSPSPLLPEVVATLRDRTGPTGIYRRPLTPLAPGMRLRIEEGPLRGMDVIFEQELSGPERVAVLLAEVNLQARVVLSRRSLTTH
jgi:transcription antitermination factor NusG